MKYAAEINVMPLKALLDPQGKAVTSGLKKMGFSTVDNVRIGKHITLEVEAEDYDSAKELVDLACKKLLSNTVIEDYHFELHEMKIA
jgi:phosphoribosylformylglycinamidine synthase